MAAMWLCRYTLGCNCHFADQYVGVLKYTPISNQTCSYFSLVKWFVESCDEERKKSKSSRLLVVNTPHMCSHPFSRKLFATSFHISTLPSSLSIDMTRRARSAMFSMFSQVTADNKHAAGIHLSGLPATQLRHTHPAQIHHIVSIH